MRFWRAFLLANPKARQLPPVYSTVIHQSGRVWNAPTCLADLFPDWAKPLCLPNGQPVLSSTAFHLIDLAAIPFDALHEAIIANAALDIMKLIDDAQPARHFGPVIGLLGDAYQQQDAHPIIALLLRYVMVHADKIDIPRLRAQIANISNPNLSSTIMTIAEQLITEGRIQGIREGEARGLREGEARGKREGEARGKRETLQMILSKRFGTLSDHHIARINSASLAQLEVWTEAALDAAAVDQVFADR